MYQKTIANETELCGTGLHSGKNVKIKLSPAPAYAGTVFFIYTPEGVFHFRPSPSTVHATELATTLKYGKYSIATVEHLLAALTAMEIDNIHVHIKCDCSSETTEIPILDGSAHGFVRALKKAKTYTFAHERMTAKISKPVCLTEDRKSIVARPYAGLYIDYLIDFEHPTIGQQRYKIDVTPESFSRICRARTFGFLREVEYLHSKGLALGGSLKNAVVLDDKGVVNPEGLRYKDEFVRHKVLDFIGDMAILGLPLQGSFEIKCSGHRHNNNFIHHLMQEDALVLSYPGSQEAAANAVYTDEYASGQALLSRCLF